MFYLWCTDQSLEGTLVASDRRQPERTAEQMRRVAGISAAVSNMTGTHDPRILNREEIKTTYKTFIRAGYELLRMAAETLPYLTYRSEQSETSQHERILRD